jgi:hypothetical protein
MDPTWAIDVRDQCHQAKVPFFFKQWGGKNKKQAGRVLGGRTWDEMPEEPACWLPLGVLSSSGGRPTQRLEKRRSHS